MDVPKICKPLVVNRFYCMALFHSQTATSCDKCIFMIYYCKFRNFRDVALKLANKARFTLSVNDSVMSPVREFYFQETSQMYRQSFKSPSRKFPNLKRCTKIGEGVS